ncbi:MAG: helix-turn-helix domain-containing protein [Syntrophobacteraceae bacterium]
MSVSERRPRKELAGLIGRFWCVSKNDPDGPGTFEILPDGNFDLVFLLDDSCCKLLFAGPYTRKARVPMFDFCQCFGIRFRPGKMPRIADIRPAELVDTIINPPKVLGIDINDLGEQLRSSEDIDSKRKLMEDMFIRAGGKTLLRGDLANHCTDLVESCDGRIRVRDLARVTGISVRTLERVFIEQVGLPPKKFIRLVRFQSALNKLKEGIYRSLAELAYDCGYTDQSHFIKDFKELSGISPSCA